MYNINNYLKSFPMQIIFAKRSEIPIKTLKK